MRTAFIINPASAGGRTAERFAGLRDRVKANFPDSEFLYTERPRHAEELARSCAQQGFARIIGVGGDGTLNEVVNGLFVDERPVNKEVVFGLLPMGTGGDFIRTLCIPRSPEKALEELKENRFVHSNVGFAEFTSFEGQKRSRYFINLLNFGVGGLTSLEANKSSKAFGGTLTFMKASLSALFKFKSRSVSIKVNQIPYYSGFIENVALANGKYCGGGMYMAPGARPDSGQFQLVVFETLPKIRLMWHMPKMYWGGHLGQSFVKTCQVQDLEVETTADDLFLEMDGETPGRLPLRAKCLQNALKVNVGRAFH